MKRVLSVVTLVLGLLLIPNVTVNAANEDFLNSDNQYTNQIISAGSGTRIGSDKEGTAEYDLKGIKIHSVEVTKNPEGNKDSDAVFKIVFSQKYERDVNNKKTSLINYCNGSLKEHTWTKGKDKYSTYLNTWDKDGHTFFLKNKGIFINKSGREFLDKYIYYNSNMNSNNNVSVALLNKIKEYGKKIGYNNVNVRMRVCKTGTENGKWFQFNGINHPQGLKDALYFYLENKDSKSDNAELKDKPRFIENCGIYTEQSTNISKKGQSNIATLTKISGKIHLYKTPWTKDPEAFYGDSPFNECVEKKLTPEIAKGYVNPIIDINGKTTLYDPKVDLNGEPNEVNFQDFKSKCKDINYIKGLSSNVNTESGKNFSYNIKADYMEYTKTTIYERWKSYKYAWRRWKYGHKIESNDDGTYNVYKTHRNNDWTIAEELVGENIKGHEAARILAGKIDDTEIDPNVFEYWDGKYPVHYYPDKTELDVKYTPSTTYNYENTYNGLNQEKVCEYTVTNQEDYPTITPYTPGVYGEENDIISSWITANKNLVTTDDGSAPKIDVNDKKVDDEVKNHPNSFAFTIKDYGMNLRSAADAAAGTGYNITSSSISKHGEQPVTTTKKVYAAKQMNIDDFKFNFGDLISNNQRNKITCYGIKHDGGNDTNKTDTFGGDSNKSYNLETVSDKKHVYCTFDNGEVKVSDNTNNIKCEFDHYNCSVCGKVDKEPHGTTDKTITYITTPYCMQHTNTNCKERHIPIKFNIYKNRPNCREIYVKGRNRYDVLLRDYLYEYPDKRESDFIRYAKDTYKQYSYEDEGKNFYANSYREIERHFAEKCEKVYKIGYKQHCNICDKDVIFGCNDYNAYKSFNSYDVSEMKLRHLTYPNIIQGHVCDCKRTCDSGGKVTKMYKCPVCGKISDSNTCKHYKNMENKVYMSVASVSNNNSENYYFRLAKNICSSPLWGISGWFEVEYYQGKIVNGKFKLADDIFTISKTNYQPILSGNATWTCNSTVTEIR